MKVIVTGAVQATEEELKAIRALGVELTFHGDEHTAVENPEQYEAAICNSLFYYQDIEQFTSLKYIQVISVGLDRLPMAYIREKGIRVRNVGRTYSKPMAEWTLMRILELVKNSRRLEERQKAHLWKKDRTNGELCGKRALLIGYGAYGQEIAKRLSAFDVEITLANRSPKQDAYISHYVPLTELKAELPTADLVILAVAAEAGDGGKLLGAEELALMKEGALLINGARGVLVEEAALIEALKNGPLAGAAMDVFEKEPLSPDSPLWDMDNVLLSPHVSFLGSGNHARTIETILTNLKEELSRQ